MSGVNPTEAQRPEKNLGTKNRFGFSKHYKFSYGAIGDDATTKPIHYVLRRRFTPLGAAASGKVTAMSSKIFRGDAAASAR